MLRFLCLLLGSVLASRAAEVERVLHVARALEVRGLKAFQPGGVTAFYAEGELAAAPLVRWEFDVPAEGAYQVRVLARSSAPGVFPQVRLTGEGWHQGRRPLPTSWDRLEVGVLRLRAGKSSLELSFAPGSASAGRVAVQALELMPVDQVEPRRREATAARADTAWLRRAGFGLMLHWTRETAPFQGPRKGYADAVAALDVTALAERVSATGAGFVVFTTSHAFQDFPAPLASLERALPGRTTRRDLIADLGEALRRKDVKLMLYHNPGTSVDVEWAKVSGLADGDLAKHFGLWREIIAEAGRRYGPTVTGWWFDDGATGFYYRQAPWPSLHEAARAGHPARLVGFNSWELPSVTDWQDFDCGEGLRDPRGREGRISKDGTGVYRSGSWAGQQATACVMLDGDWVHHRVGQMPPPPNWTETELRNFLSGARRTGLVPILNAQITQEGLLAPQTIDLLRRARNPR